MINQPLVSVCIPAFNAAKYIGQTLTAICNQNYSNLEVVVVNDASTDNTLEVIAGFDDERIKLYDTLNAGAAVARNIAYANCSGDYIIFFDADDLMEPGFVASQVQAIAGRNNVVVLSAWGRFYGDDTAALNIEPLPAADMSFKEWINHYWYNANPMTNPGRALIPRKLIDEAGGWNEELSLNDDLEFFTRIFLKAESLVFNHNAALAYRSGVKGLSGVKSYPAYVSLYQSIALSVDLVLTHYKNEPGIQQSCANMWQSFIYELYPNYPQLVTDAEAQVKKLVRPTLGFPSGGVTKILSGILGWKAAKRLKQMLN
ncbi:hypothetical protein GCM10027037_24120 [Mucilaginibacter koreensis]